MGKLLFGSEDHNEWYVGDENDRERFKYQLFWIWQDYIWHNHENYLPKVAIRKFVENDLNGDVWLSNDSFEKRTHKSAWDTTGSSNIRYIIFNFEEETDAAAFRLKYDKCVQTQEMMDELKNTETWYQKEKREAIERGEYWKDRRD